MEKIMISFQMPRSVWALGTDQVEILAPLVLEH